LLRYLRSTGRFSYGSSQTKPSSAITIEESYKILGLKRGCSKEEVMQAANKLQKKIHPDLNRDINTERISQLVNEAKENIIKTDFA
jgi:DnaJ-class molecular chaperone